jgi:hypothetical protein
MPFDKLKVNFQIILINSLLIIIFNIELFLNLEINIITIIRKIILITSIFQTFTVE